jgi:ribonuclease J
LYHAALDANKPFLVDEFQKEVMDTIVNDSGLWNKSSLYQYGKYPPYDVSHNINPKLKKLIEDKGYVLIARVGPQFDKIINLLPGEKQNYLSMWEGYVDKSRDAYNEELAKSLGKDYEYMHTSGHCDINSLREVFRMLHPKAIVPIHTDNPEQFAKEFGNEWQVHLLNDGDSISL